MGKVSDLLQLTVRLKVFLIVGLGLWPSWAASSPSVASMVVDLTVYPEREQLLAQTRIDLEGLAPGDYTAVFSQPKALVRFINLKTGEDVRHRFAPYPGAPESAGFRIMEFTIESSEPRQSFVLTYEYDGKTLAGFAANPATNDNLHMGQITKDSIFSSHLYYYPEMFGGSRKATVRITVPKGWRGVSSGTLRSAVESEQKTTFVYEADFHSGRLPYSLAIYPYEEMRFVHDGRLPVSIYYSKADEGYARQKVHIIGTKILPFLENLMGPFPFDSLKVIEVFPWQGNTGLAAKGNIMLSQKMWFAGDIDENLSALPASVLVDEIAHQWNFYNIQLPNFLAEGVSQYTDSLFTERVRGKQAFEKEIAEYRDVFLQTTALLKALKPLFGRGISLEEAARKLELPVEKVRPYWPYAEFGEVPIADPRVFPELYFLKGALALNALRSELGDEAFFRSFRLVFQDGKRQREISLDEFREAFERESGKSLKGFFDLWYHSPGLPKLQL